MFLKAKNFNEFACKLNQNKVKQLIVKFEEFFEFLSITDHFRRINLIAN